VKPVVFLLATWVIPPTPKPWSPPSRGFGNKRDALQRFVQASGRGWKSYLSDPAPGNVLIMKGQPANGGWTARFGVRKMREYGLVPEATRRKNGLLTRPTPAGSARMNSCWLRTAQASVDYRQAYTLDIVNKVRCCRTAASSQGLRGPPPRVSPVAGPHGKRLELTGRAPTLQ